MRKRRIFRKLEWLSQNRNLECFVVLFHINLESATPETVPKNHVLPAFNFWAGITQYQLGIDLENKHNKIVVVYLTLLELEGQLPKRII